jgi:nucleoid-associated protein
MSIKKVVIHEVQRQVDQGLITTQFRASLNDIKGLSADLTEDLIKLFASASLSIGGFGVNGNHDLIPPYEQLLKLYEPTQSDANFLHLTVEMAKTFENILKQPSKGSVKGGFLVFYEYTYRNDGWIAVAILQRTEGLDVNAGLEVIASKLLDLKKLHLGATVNISQWKAEKTERYIKFKTGLAGELRDYFESFIGCQRDKNAIKTETKDLKVALEGFCKAKLALGPEAIQDLMEEAYKYISPKLSKGEPVLLTSIAKKLFPDNTSDFEEYLEENKISLSEDLAIDRWTLNQFQRITAKWKGINLTFSRKAVDSTVIFENGKIVLKDVPQQLIDDIKAEQESRKPMIEIKT